MPILAREIDIFPDDLLTGQELDGDGESSWWAVYTRSRQEKALIRSLHSLEIPFYCPIIAHRFRSPAGRVRTSFLPLFRNYVFMYSDGFNRHRALKTNFISRIIEVENGAELRSDLRQLQLLIAAGTPLSVETNLQPGIKVRIKTGPLVGVVGVILKRQGRDHLVVAVNFLQQGASVRLDEFEVEPIQ